MIFFLRKDSLKVSFDCLDNHQGSALIIVLIVMAVLTLVGLSTINTASIENRIVRNERVYQENFYLAESGVNEAAQKIENETNSDNLIPYYSSWLWMHDVVDSNNNPMNFSDPDNWVYSVSSSDNSEQAAVNTDAFFSSVFKGVARGSSLDIGDSNTRLYEYAVFGHGKTNSGNAIIEIGYLKRF